MTGLDRIKKNLKDSEILKNEYIEKYKIFFVPVTVLALGILISVLVTIPQFLKLFDTFRSINELNAKKTFYQQKQQRLESIDEGKYRLDLDTALVALPVEKDIPGVLGELLVALGGSGLNLEGITFSVAPPESEKTQEYAVTINASGEESSLRNFLERVTVSPRLIKLTSIEVSRNSGKNISAGITFVTFYQLLPKSIGSVDDKLPEFTQADTVVLADIAQKVKSFPKVGSQTSQSTRGKLDPFRP